MMLEHERCCRPTRRPDVRDDHPRAGSPELRHWLLAFRVSSASSLLHFLTTITAVIRKSVARRATSRDRLDQPRTPEAVRMLFDFAGAEPGDPCLNVSNTRRLKSADHCKDCILGGFMGARCWRVGL